MITRAEFYDTVAIRIGCLLVLAFTFMVLHKSYGATPKTSKLEYKCFVIEGESTTTCGMPEREFNALIDAYNAAAARELMTQKLLATKCMTNT